MMILTASDWQEMAQMSQAQAKESIKSFLVTNYECEMNCKLVKDHEFYVRFRN